MDIPVYLIAGFLDAGKTNFINGILADGFAADDKTLLLSCEEGEESYPAGILKNVEVLPIEDEETLNCAFLKQCEKKYRPKQVIIEYNGMWPLEKLYRDILPANWILYQIMTMVDARSFESYAKNMGQLMMEKIVNADMLIFNRCNEGLRAALRARNLRMVNRRADIFLENEDGSSESYLTGSECPFDVSGETVEIPDDDFGVWYVDAMDHPQRYNDKLVHLKLVMCHSKKFKGTACPGRFAMVCCEKDVTFLGIVCKGEGLDAYRNRDWIEIRARVRAEEHPAYEGVGPVLYLQSIAPCEKLEQEVVSF